MVAGVRSPNAPAPGPDEETTPMLHDAVQDVTTQ
jgi:hypothetical protein